MSDFSLFCRLYDNNVFNQNPNLNINIFLLANRKTKIKPYHLFKFKANNSANENIVGIIIDYILVLKDYTSLNDNNLIEYDPDDDLEFFKFTLNIPQEEEAEAENKNSEIPLFSYIRDKIQDIGNVEEFTYNCNLKSKLVAWIINIETNNNSNETFTFFQKFRKSKMLDQDKFFFRLFENQYKLIEEDIISMGKQLEVMFFNDVFYISNLSAFESIFDMQRVYIDKAQKLVNKLTDYTNENLTIKITDSTKIENRIIDSKRFTKRLFTASKNRAFEKIDFQKLIDFNSQKNLNLKLNIDNKSWIVDESIDLETFSRIINDEYEKSLLTDIQYLVSKKKRI